MADWTETLTLSLTLMNEKSKCFDSNVWLNRILKRTMMCEESMGVTVKTVIFLSRKIFFGAGDRLPQKCLCI